MFPPKANSCLAHRRRALSQSGQVFVPKCVNDKYNSLQCFDEKHQCWCVDGNGNELINTRTTGGKPNCKDPGLFI